MAFYPRLIHRHYNLGLEKGTFTSVDQLEEAIGSWTDGWNDDPRTFIWKKPADEMVAKVQRR